MAQAFSSAAAGGTWRGPPCCTVRQARFCSTVENSFQPRLRQASGLPRQHLLRRQTPRLQTRKAAMIRNTAR
jgi:hypothetical protein